MPTTYRVDKNGTHIWESTGMLKYPPKVDKEGKKTLFYSTFMHDFIIDTLAEKGLWFLIERTFGNYYTYVLQDVTDEVLQELKDLIEAEDKERSKYLRG